MSYVRCQVCREYVVKETTRPVGLGHQCLDLCYSTAPVVHKVTKHRHQAPRGVRKAVLARDGACRRCGGVESLQAHHVLYRSQGGPDTLENLLCLCADCHALAHSDKKRYQPILLGVLSLGDQGQFVSALQLERWVEAGTHVVDRHGLVSRASEPKTDL